jgi:hypothetical protein
VSLYWVLKLAVTAVAALRTREQVPVPEHAPPQPVKCACTADPSVAVSTTVLPNVNVAVHEALQLMPAGLLVTVPPAGPE